MGCTEEHVDQIAEIAERSPRDRREIAEFVDEFVDELAEIVVRARRGGEGVLVVARPTRRGRGSY